MDGSQFNWVHETPNPAQAGQPKSLYNETGARRRRAHQKSRKGCLGCKHRRVKCDEGRPACGQCVERKWPCDFGGAAPVSTTTKSGRSTPKPSTTPPASETQSSSPPSDLGDHTEGSREWTRTRVLAFLERTNVPCQLGDYTVYQRHDILELMDHFEDTIEPWIGSSKAQRWIQVRGLQLGLMAPYLLHAILAYSAKHLSYLHPDNKTYSTAATMHYTRSLQAYSSQLVYEIELGNATALLAASGMLAKLSFINTPVMSTEAAGGDPVPAWIRSMQGMKTIMQTPKLRDDLEGGVLSSVVQYYNGTADGAEELADPQASDGTILAFQSLCAANSNCHATNPYTTVLARLERLMRIDPNHEKVDQYLAFIARLEPSFIELLRQRDARAMLILAYWCARLSLIQQWWTAPSAHAECRRLCAFLAPHPDPMIQMLLRFPAGVCGFEGEGAVQLPTPPMDG